MAKTWLLVLIAILSLGFGAGMFYLWSDMRPADEEMIKWGVSALTAFAAFVSIYFMTKGGGGGGD